MSLPPKALPAPDQVDVWLVRPERLPAPLFARLDALLTPEERERRDRFRFDHLRRDFAVTRGLVREVLSVYLPEIQPSAWAFDVGEKGKPSPRLPAGVTDFAMNVSHTEGLIGIAIAPSEVGMDLETLARRAPLEVADRYFAEEEIAALHALPDAEKSERFLTLWTLKEAWLKAIGKGITHSLSSIALDPTKEPPTARFDADSPPGPWQLARFRPTDTHLGAVCLLSAAPIRIEPHWPYGT